MNFPIEIKSRVVGSTSRSLASVIRRARAKNEPAREQKEVGLHDCHGFLNLLLLGCPGALRAEIIDPKIAFHHGRIVKTTGDGFLLEFASVVDALRCAAEMQAA